MTVVGADECFRRAGGFELAIASATNNVPQTFANLPRSAGTYGPSGSFVVRRETCSRE